MVARPGVVQAAGTGRDKPVPYNARAGTVHEFGTERNLFPSMEQIRSRLIRHEL